MRHSNHSQTSRELRTRIISRLKMLGGHSSHSQTGDQRIGVISRPEMKQGITATHTLESQGQALSAGLSMQHSMIVTHLL